MNRQKPTARRKFSQDILFSIKYPTTTVPLALSPDGRWLAITLQSAKSCKLSELGFTKNGVKEEFSGSSVVIFDTKTCETIDLFPNGSTSWSPLWAPDSKRLVAYVQHEGHACLGVWDKDSSICTIHDDVKVRTNMGFELPRWTADGRRLVLKAYHIPEEPRESELSVKVYRNDSDDPDS